MASLAAAAPSAAAAHSLRSTRTDPESEVVEVDDEDDNEDDENIDEEQLEEYREMVEQLGSFPDKVAINSLSMVAEDHADSRGSAKQIYNVIRNRLVTTSNSSNLLPLVYVLDSILKNVKGQYIRVIEDDADTWLGDVYRKLPEIQKQKLKKVYQTWVDSKLFKEERLRMMGRCLEAGGGASVPNQSSSSTLSGGLRTAVVAGITRASDGRLLLPVQVRKAMEEILDQLQSDMENELDKVSLERLADLNPELLGNIKQTAEQTLKTTTGANGANDSGGTSTAASSASLPSYFVETRSSDEVERSKAWRDLKLQFPSEATSVTGKLRELVDRERSGWDGAKLYTQREATNWTRVLAGALATASLLQSASDRLQQQQSQSPKSSGGGSSGATLRTNQRGLYSQGAGGGMGFSVDKSLFTNRGVMERNDTVIGILYEVGLPFVSSVDGRRFATQQELSSHLDSLFRRNQLEKAMARTEERGWFVAEFVWTLDKKDDSDPNSSQFGLGAMGSDSGTARDTSADGYDPVTSSVPADETRDRCVVCGINFKMAFDNDDGVYKYTNCREIEMLNDDTADVESEPVLVHVTCWRGLGSPDVLTADQALQETLHHYS